MNPLEAKLTSKGELTIHKDTLHGLRVPEVVKVTVMNSTCCGDKHIVLHCGSRTTDYRWKQLYRPAERSTSIRVSVRTELSELGVNLAKFSGHSFPVSLAEYEGGEWTLSVNFSEAFNGNGKSNTKNGSGRTKH